MSSDGEIDKQKAARYGGLSLIIILALTSLRGWAEWKIGATPIGFDSSNAYVTQALTFHGNLFQSLESFNFLYFIFYIFHHFLKIDALILIKITGTVLFFLFLGTFFLLLRDVFQFRKPLLPLGVLIFGLQLSTLRFTWDLFRNELGLIFFFLAVWQFFLFLKNKKLLFLLVSLISAGLTLGTHQLVGLLCLLFIAISGLYWVGKRLNQPWLSIFLPLIFIALWLVVSSHLSNANIPLWVSNTGLETGAGPKELFALLVPGLLLVLAIIGLIIKRWLPLAYLSLLILIQSFSPLLFHGKMFFLWDRWMYFIGIPLVIYALAGIDWLRQALTKVRLPAGISYVFLTIPLLTPSLPFINPTASLNPNNVSRPILNYFPKTLVWNALGTPHPEDILTAGAILGEHYDKKSPILIDWRYEGLIRYYLPGLVPYTYFIQGKDISPFPTHYYTLGYNYSQIELGTNLPGSTESCPITYHP